MQVHNVDILASSLEGEDIGEVLSKLGLDTAAIHTLNISGNVLLLLYQYFYVTELLFNVQTYATIVVIASQ